MEISTRLIENKAENLRYYLEYMDMKNTIKSNIASDMKLILYFANTIGSRILGYMLKEIDKIDIGDERLYDFLHKIDFDIKIGEYE